MVDFTSDSQVPRSRVTRSRWAVGLLLAVALGAMLNYGWNKTGLLSRLGQRDGAAWIERRLAPLKPLLPAKGQIGYLTDQQASLDYTSRFILVQFAVAPAVLKDGVTPNTEYVLGNYKNPTQADFDRAAKLGLRVVKDAGHGLILYRRRP